MSLVLESAILPPHLLQDKPTSWPSPYHPQYYPAPGSSPASMSPQSLHSYMPRQSGSPLPSQELNSQPTSGWYVPSISAPECHSETSYAPYNHYMPPHTSSINLSPHAPAFHHSARAPVSTPQSLATISPGTIYSRDSVVPKSARPSEEPQSDARSIPQQSTSRLRRQSHLMDQPHSGSDSLHSATVENSWTVNALGIHSNHEVFYPTYTTHSPRLSEPSIELSSSQMTSPQPRRVYTPIAPLPLETPRSHGTKRFREDEEEEEPKRRKRSDSQMSTQFELSEEDRLLLRLKKEENMPWKDIAARFHTDLNKSYQIPALQMRIKRLLERMRVWTEADLKALRMAHDYWEQSKFEIISQKMLEFGAQDKWPARQCSRKWQEIDPAPTSYAQFEHGVQQGFAPYAMSPIESAPSNYYGLSHTDTV
ncbi:hypothetical protein G6011_04400 [Alternaria panax]|uniref:Myb-like domain-containing protein n=1 Tax=Alternaria panax TaxID=48097 RepID=A0AAD4NUX2_9PLEO|nr:hypothetical protein G6011_04400 [Alternaria panax]